jgi:hypothetical protein
LRREARPFQLGGLGLESLHLLAREHVARFAHPDEATRALFASRNPPSGFLPLGLMLSCEAILQKQNPAA